MNLNSQPFRIPRTLRSRVVAWYAGLLAATLLAFGIALYIAVQQYLVTTYHHSLLIRSETLAANFLRYEEAKGVEWMGVEIGETYAPEISGRFIRITRGDGAQTGGKNGSQSGKVLYESGPTADKTIDPAGIAPHPFDYVRGQPSFRRETQGENHLLIYSAPYISPSGTHYLIETGGATGTLEHVLSRLRLILAIITPLTLLLAAFGGQALMKLPLRPLVTLTEQAERIGTHELGERLPVIPTGDEMERLSLSLNRMISRLEDALNHNRRFSADVSHELRTPLTILRGEIEQLLRDPQLSNYAHDTAGSALEEIDRMAKIVESLLAISRLDSGSDLMERRNVDLSELTVRTTEQMHLLADEKAIKLSVDTVPTVIQADPARIKQVLVNLIDNAIKYTPVGGSVSIKVDNVGRCGVFQISDTGIGIGPAALPHIFERFYRTDKARSRVSGGTGLGLSIVNAIVKAHSGTIDVSSVEGQGTTVHVELPLSTSTETAATDIASVRRFQPEDASLLTR